MDQRQCRICEEDVFGDLEYQLCDQCLTTVLFSKEAHSDNWNRFVAHNGKSEYYRRVDEQRVRYSSDISHYAELDRLREEAEKATSLIPLPSVEVSKVLAEMRQLTPELIDHLRQHKNDLLKIHPDVLEHLVGEFFKQRKMFDQVALVGRDFSTSADLFAGKKVASNETYLRVFVEVKRWRDKIGIQVIDHIIGAMFGEKDQHGWHAAMLVTTSTLAKIKKYSLEDIKRKGVTVREQSDLLCWLEDYSPNKRGLWLPKPPRMMPKGLGP